MRSGDLVETTASIDFPLEVSARRILDTGSVLIIMSVDRIPSFRGGTYTMITAYHSNSDTVFRIDPRQLKLLSRNNRPWPSMSK